MLATWRAAVVGLMKSLSPNWRLLRPAASKCNTSNSRAVKPCELARVAPWFSPKRTRVADAERAEATDRVPERRLRPESFEDGCRAPDQSGIVALGQGTRLLVRAAELVPGSGRRRIVAGDLEGVRLGQIVGRDVPVAGLPQQPGEFAPLPAIAAREDEVTHRLRFFPRSLAVTIQESRFGARGADRSQAQQLPGALGQRQCLVERRRGLGTATASTHLAQRRQRHHPRH